MTNLRINLQKDIEETAQDLNEQYTLGAIDLHMYGTKLSCLIFRSQSTDYWALDGRGMQWYCFSKSAWKPMAGVPSRLEGLADLPIFHSSLNEKRTKIDETELPPETKGSRPDHQIYSEFVDLIHSAYQDGDLTSDEAEAYLYSHFLIARNGLPWTLGVKTRHWYRFNQDKWQMSKTPPTDMQLARLPGADRLCPKCGKETAGESQCPHCGAELPTSLALDNKEAWIAMTDYLVNSLGELPEQLIEPWQPPAWYPDAIHPAGVTCTLCQASNPAGSRFCNSCGSPFLQEQDEPKSTQKQKAESPKTSMICLSCGAILAPGKKFCTNCGTPVKISG